MGNIINCISDAVFNYIVNLFLGFIVISSGELIIQNKINELFFLFFIMVENTSY
ncbi:hypothetical protein PROVRETT_06412 [Providencia rettgeri DSM 1131]|nr:hypothetical protein PROVRETT_06412 [Providencia rettgeri DSM 1131]